MSSDTETIKRVLTPVLAQPVKVRAAISDAQMSLRDAIAALWPDIPHQTCQFHYLQEAARPIFEQDRAMRTKMRQKLAGQLRPLRPQLERHLAALQHSQVIGAPMTHEQLSVLYDYVVAKQASLQFDGRLPFDYAGLLGYEALSELAESLARLEKKS